MEALRALTMEWVHVNIDIPHASLRFGGLHPSEYFAYRDIEDKKLAICPHCSRFLRDGTFCYCGSEGEHHHITDIIPKRSAFPTVSVLHQLGYKMDSRRRWRKDEIVLGTNELGIVYCVSTIEGKRVWVENGELYYWSHGILVPELQYVRRYEPISMKTKNKILKLFNAASAAEGVTYV